MADIGAGGERFAFDDDVRSEEVERLNAGGRAHGAVLAARAQIERPGARIAASLCHPEGADGTRLARCAKVYLPLDTEPSRARTDSYSSSKSNPTRRVTLRMLA
jgi:hypothetical protein